MNACVPWCAHDLCELAGPAILGTVPQLTSLCLSPECIEVQVPAGSPLCLHPSPSLAWAKSLAFA